MTARRVTLVVADLAGTTVDYGSCAPAGAFVELFRRRGVDVTMDEARGPMGLQKRDHIVELTRIPRIAAAWKSKHGAAPTDSVIDGMYAEFIPLQVKSLPEFGDVIPGVVDTVNALRARGIRVAATTGYNREMLKVVVGCAKDRGFVPDAAFCAEDVAAGRPAPWMVYRSMEALGAYPPETVVNFGDTIPDVASGRNAGVWSVGITRTGNMLGLSEAEDHALNPGVRLKKLSDAEARMTDAGAHFAIDAFAECIPVIDEVEARLARGERP